MIYGYIKDSTVIVVGAADNLAEYQDFYKLIIHEENPTFVCSQPEFDDLLMNYKGFREPPYVFDFKTNDAAMAFAESHQITLGPPHYIADKQREMVKPKGYGGDNDYFADKRTLGEMYGLNEYDPWDTRTEEEKTQDEKHKKVADEAKKKGNLTGESFTQSSEPTLQVDTVRVSKDADGNYQIDDILAYKGLYSKSVEEIKSEHQYKIDFAQPINVNSALGIDLSEYLTPDGSLMMSDPTLAHRVALFYGNEPSQVVLLNEDGLPAEPNEEVAAILLNTRDKIYHKIFIENARLEQIIENVPHLILEKSVDRGETRDGCWFVFHAKPSAMMVEASLKTFLSLFITAIKIFPVNIRGEQLVPEGINMFEEKPFVEPPRPWNERAHELDNMTAEELEANYKSLSGREFLFSGKYIDAQAGCIMYVTPRSYFEKTGETWTGEFLDISIILPMDVKEISPGVYQTRSREWMSLYHDMQKRNFTESMAFQLYINLLG